MTESSPISPADLADRIIAGEDAAVDLDTLTRLFAGEASTWDIMAAADRIRRAFFGDEIHLCSIVNGKQGGCPEDCGFCSQSKHFSTHVTPERFLSPDEVVEASATAQTQQASALGLVTATRGLEDDSVALQKVVDGVKAERDAGNAEAHGSFGFVSREGHERLKDAGLTELNHNLETGRGYFDKIVSTHSYDERIQTIKDPHELGLRSCSGGILGMGEQPVHRAELALTLRELDVDEVPLNFLVSIDGTKLEEVNPMSPMEMLRAIACFRLALPRQNIFIAAGRMHLGQLTPLMFAAGASGMMVGDFLTTANRSVEDDLAMLEELGLRGRNCGTARPEMSRPRPGMAARPTTEGRPRLNVLN